MVNYLRSYIPNLADISKPLRDLIKRNIVFNWLSIHTNTLEKIMQLIINSPILKTFDEKLEITIQSDSNKDGIGCCIMQSGKPISFASRSLTQAETNYSQIEKEFLAICYACKKFHN